MTTKSCGTCEFWDRENASIYGAIEKPRAECLADVPFSVRDPGMIGISHGRNSLLV